MEARINSASKLLSSVCRRGGHYGTGIWLERGESEGAGTARSHQAFSRPRTPQICGKPAPPLYLLHPPAASASKARFQSATAGRRQRAVASSRAQSEQAARYRVPSQWPGGARARKRALRSTTCRLRSSPRRAWGPHPPLLLSLSRLACRAGAKATLRRGPGGRRACADPQIALPGRRYELVDDPSTDSMIAWGQDGHRCGTTARWDNYLQRVAPKSGARIVCPLYLLAAVALHLHDPLVVPDAAGRLVVTSP